MTDELIIGFTPKTDKEEACLMTIHRESGSLVFGHGRVSVIKSFYGKEAEDLYLKLIGGDEDGES